MSAIDKNSPIDPRMNMPETPPQADELSQSEDIGLARDVLKNSHEPRSDSPTLADHHVTVKDSSENLNFFGKMESKSEKESELGMFNPVTGQFENKELENSRQKHLDLKFAAEDKLFVDQGDGFLMNIATYELISAEDLAARRKKEREEFI